MLEIHPPAPVAYGQALQDHVGNVYVPLAKRNDAAFCAPTIDDSAALNRPDDRNRLPGDAACQELEWRVPSRCDSDGIPSDYGVNRCLQPPERIGRRTTATAIPGHNP